MIRILHVATVMGSGGLEKWLVDLVVEMNRGPYESHILVQSDYFGLHGQRARQMGLSIIPIASSRHIGKFAYDLLRILRTRGPFDVVHSHVHNLSGVVLTLAKLSGVPVRVAHGHNDDSQEYRSVFRKLYISISRRLIYSFASRGYGVSEEAARDLFASAYGKDKRWSVLPCGISLELFEQNYDRSTIRSELGLPPRSLVLAQVGRLTYMKNQDYSLRLLAQLDDPDSVLLLLGAGELEQQYRMLAHDLGISRRVVFAGARSDIPRILCGAADVFLFPSRPGEGAPIALIEAQAAGLPCIVSDHIPQASVVVPTLVEQLSLSPDLHNWVAAVRRAIAVRAAVPRQFALGLIAESPYTIAANCRALAPIYHATCRSPAYQ